MADTPTDQELLDATIQQIYAITTRGFANMTVNERTSAMLSLKDLREQRSELEARVAASAASNRGNCGVMQMTPSN